MNPVVSATFLFSGFPFRRGTMREFYYQVWVPFTITKRRILFLAIASYLALC